MDVRLSPLSSPTLGGLRSPLAARPAGTGEAAGAGVAESFKSALRDVSQAQNQASSLQTRVQMGDPKVSLEETMLAMQKAQIGFQATLHVRNRMVQAYTDIMNMSV
ncbi:flagellar hook-basal body complex protein FliE [uncultured Hydrogenophaga sp.]|uniref:flagellar hook-basal body complex protein FliE n=1 Tax=uncultured Hydrogenophaga sp. TaxID=199683 RepID=UPI00265F6352|nr:flagellar hook-basal body complex protein FliE [uncultured Hydrogenophaga sp.]